MFDRKTYKETFSALHASEDTLMEVVKMTRKTKKSFHLSKTIALVAVMTTLFSITAAATIGFIRYGSPGAMLQSFWGTNVDSHNGIVEYDEDGGLVTNIPAWERIPVDESLAEELIAPYIFAVEKAVECGEYTLEVEAALFDAATGAGMLYYTVESSGGVSGYEVFPDGELFWPVESPVFTIMGAGRSYIDTAMSSDTKLYICTYYIVDSEAKSIDVGIGLGPGEDRSKTNNITVELPGDIGMLSVELEGGAVKISPVGIQIDRSALGFSSLDDLHYIVLHYADGTEYVVRDADAFVSNYTYALNNQEITTYTFNRIVDTNSVVSIEIENAKYRMD